jgi:hypothetical protein
VAGAFSPSTVQTNRQLNETVGGLKLLNANTNQVSAYQLRTFVETWAEPVLEQLSLLERAYETDDVILALAGAKAELVKKFGIKAITDDLLSMDITMNISISGVGNVSPQEQINNFIRAMEALRRCSSDGTLEKYGLDVHEVIAELFGKLGHKDGKRFFNTGDTDPRLYSAMQTIEQLQQQLAQKVNPSSSRRRCARSTRRSATCRPRSATSRRRRGEDRPHRVRRRPDRADARGGPAARPADRRRAATGGLPAARRRQPARWETSRWPVRRRGRSRTRRRASSSLPGGAALQRATRAQHAGQPEDARHPGTGADAGIETVRSPG